MLLLSVMDLTYMTVQGVLRAEDDLAVGAVELFGSFVNL
jgi:hypothetical protein